MKEREETALQNLMIKKKSKISLQIWFFFLVYAYMLML